MSTLDHPLAVIAKGTVAAMRQAPKQRRARTSGPLGAPFDPFDPMTIQDRATAYRRLHANPGVHHIGRGCYALSGHRDVREAARAHSILVSGMGVTAAPAALPMLLTSDRPRHDELRRLLTPHFTSARVCALEPAMRDVIGTAIERMLDRPGSDAVAGLAVPLPITVIARMLGVPDEQRDLLHTWSDGIVQGFHADGTFAGVARAASSIRHTIALRRYLLGVFAGLRREPGNDVISALLRSNATGGLGDDELFWLSMMLIVAGNETTTNLIGSMLFALATDPEAFRRIRSEPGLVRPAVEEAARWGSPVQGLYRTAVADFSVGTTTVLAGARVLLLFGAANRDPRVYPEPDRYVVDRAPRDHLGFGSGIHFCLGATLARLEARLVLEELTARVTSMKLAGPVTWSDNPSVHGPSRLPLHLEA
ncbi:MAG TPA: cytochrome P450 [Nocardioidaceae bacterium]|nr:cytochrome P450 [Nocardioidaceae bacterium]